MDTGRRGSRRCSLHNIDYPAWVDRCQVPGCDEELSYFNVPHDPDWRDQVGYQTRVQEAVEARTAETPLFIPEARLSPIEHKGHLFVSHDGLLRAGYRCIQDFDVVWSRGRYYELQGHLPSAVGGGAWWVEEIWADEPAPDSPPPGW